MTSDNQVVENQPKEEIKEIAEEIQESNQLKPEETAPGAPSRDVVKEFDKLSEVRQAALKEVDKILARGSKGCKLNRSDYNKALYGLRSIVGSLNDLISGLMYDIVRLVHISTNTDRSLNTLFITIEAIGEILKKKELVSNEEFDIEVKTIMTKLEEANKKMQEQQVSNRESLDKENNRDLLPKLELVKEEEPHE